MAVTEMNVREAVEAAERVLPGTAAPDGVPDPRWQAIIEISEVIEGEPEPVWAFINRWARHADPDLRAAIATCFLEHLLEHHFAAFFPRVEAERSAVTRISPPRSLYAPNSGSPRSTLMQHFLIACSTCAARRCQYVRKSVRFIF